MPPKFYLEWTDTNYGDAYNEVFNTKAEAVAFINQKLAIGCRVLQLIYGRDITSSIKPVEIVKAWDVDTRDEDGGDLLL
jgi:hypothetical protein